MTPLLAAGFCALAVIIVVAVALVAVDRAWEAGWDEGYVEGFEEGNQRLWGESLPRHWTDPDLGKLYDKNGNATER